MKDVTITIECGKDNELGVRQRIFIISKEEWETMGCKELLLEDIMDVTTEMFSEVLRY